MLPVAVLSVCLGPLTDAGFLPARAVADAAYDGRHPRLLFTPPELPALRAKVRDGGVDDVAYAYIHDRFSSYYLAQPFDSLLRNDFALEAMMNTGLVAHLEEPVDSVALALAVSLTLHIARTWSVDTDSYGSSLRLRALAIGYDLCFGAATDAEQQEVRAEIVSYISYLNTNMNYDIWRWSPYVSNKTAMVAAALGIASIVLDGEVDPAITGAGLARADVFYDAWSAAHMGGDGAYREGTLYGIWSLRHLVYYFEARRRFDGHNYASDSAIRAVERWFPYEMDPRGGARLNNIQDHSDYFLPLARHATFWDWSMSAWGSEIAAYVWEHAAGAYGYDMLDDADKAATALWHREIAPRNPAELLPLSAVWESRGLYYFRTGWPDGAASDDLMFSFYSGEFRGGHAQEDQNQFTLTAYGERLVIDHGAGSTAKQSEAHNLVLIDGMGQHNAGGSIGTDGRIESYVVTDVVDYVCGDARLAYATHSPYNDPGVPYPWSDWSWGYHGANPVARALRRVIAVRGGGSLPYFIIQDDIKKDDDVHRFDWRLHVPADASVDLGVAGPVRIVKNGAALDVHALQPPRVTLAASVAPFNNYSEDPDSRVIQLGRDEVEPGFTFLLLPRRVSDAEPVLTALPGLGGATTTAVAWESGTVDFVFTRTGSGPGPLAVIDPSVGATGCPGPLATDAVLAMVRSAAGEAQAYVLVEAMLLTCGVVELVRIEDGPATVVYDGSGIHVSRADAQFRIRAQGVSDVFHHGERVPTVLEGEYLTNAVYTGVRAPARASDLELRAFPNPFNPSVRVSFVVPSRGDVRAEIHDAAGRRVAVLAARVMEKGVQALEWNGRDQAGDAAASGVYFLRVRASGAEQSIKLVLLR
jgi:hypothetical protein